MARTLRRENTVNVLSLSRNEEDHTSLQSIFGYSRWTIDTAPNIKTARSLLQSDDISVVVCDCDSLPGLWIEILGEFQAMSIPPTLIVASRLADDRLWAEALNRGAWDVLAKPFERTEVLRSVRNAWEHWHHHSQAAAHPAKAISAAS
jgi:DNA-binding NtrC family response regulator